MLSDDIILDLLSLLHKVFLKSLIRGVQCDTLTFSIDYVVNVKLFIVVEIHWPVPGRTRGFQLQNVLVSKPLVLTFADVVSKVHIALSVDIEKINEQYSVLFELFYVLCMNARVLKR